ncbi:MAG: hypothetical protein GY928_15905 [Colwellia sp.]|nr:hypothetical protein [Colwellia sp.]
MAPKLSIADEFNNLTIIHIPPYSPELNPIEQVWRWIRQNELANRCFENYNDIIEQCCRAWNRFYEDTSRVISLLDYHLCSASFRRRSGIGGVTKLAKASRSIIFSKLYRRLNL